MSLLESTDMANQQDIGHQVAWEVYSLLSTAENLCELAKDDEARALIKDEADHLAAVVLNIGCLLAAVQHANS